MRRAVIGIALALTVVLAMLVGGYYLMNARSYQLTGRLVDRVNTAQKVVALTLDDGPSPLTPEVLRILGHADVPATFYLTGRELTDHPQQGQAIVTAGHEIGNHTYSHRRMVMTSPGTVAAEVERTDAAIRQTGYLGPITFRPPYGKKLWTLPKYLSDRNRTTVTWDVEPESTGPANAEQLVEATVDAVRPGSIVLLHVMYESGAASRAALPQILDRLHSDGYQFVTVSDLIGPS